LPAAACANAVIPARSRFSSFSLNGPRVVD